MIKLIPRKIEEVKEELEQLEKKLYKEGIEPIDKKIKPLIIGFWRWGIRTTNSCEGHKDKGFKYPWVRIRLTDVGKATIILGEWQYRSSREPKPLKWIIEPAWEPRIRPSDINKPLEVLQKEAIDLGKWLQKLSDDFIWFKEPVDLGEIKKEVDEITDKTGLHINSKIKELIIGLRALGIETIAYCEGHLNWGNPYPWVDIPIYQGEMLGYLVSLQNRSKLENHRKNANSWILLPLKNSFRLIPENRNRPLEELQKDAIEFGKNLQKLAKEWSRQ